MTAMRRVERMLLELNASYNGSPWHGESLIKILSGVNEGTALSSGRNGKRSIAEIAAHILAWMDIVQRRLTGEEFEVTPSMDSPAMEGLTWEALLARLPESQTRLIDSVARMKDSDFDLRPAGKDYSMEFMLNGLLQHNSYHAGQIAILKS